MRSHSPVVCGWAVTESKSIFNRCLWPRESKAGKSPGRGEAAGAHTGCVCPERSLCCPAGSQHGVGAPHWDLGSAGAHGPQCCDWAVRGPWDFPSAFVEMGICQAASLVVD